MWSLRCRWVNWSGGRGRSTGRWLPCRCGFLWRRSVGRRSLGGRVCGGPHCPRSPGRRRRRSPRSVGLRGCGRGCGGGGGGSRYGFVFVVGCGCVVAGRAVPRAPWVGGGAGSSSGCGAVAGCASAAGDVKRGCRPVADNWCPRMLRPHIPPRPLRPVDHPAPARGAAIGGRRPFRGAGNGASNPGRPARDEPAPGTGFQGRGERREQPRTAGTWRTGSRHWLLGARGTARATTTVRGRRSTPTPTHPKPVHPTGGQPLSLTGRYRWPLEMKDATGSNSWSGTASSRSG